jgi:hypothetical protein
MRKTELKRRFLHPSTTGTKVILLLLEIVALLSGTSLAQPKATDVTAPAPALTLPPVDACDLALEALEYVGEQLSNETSPASIALEEYFSQPKEVLVSLYPIVPEWAAYQGKQSKHLSLSLSLSLSPDYLFSIFLLFFYTQTVQ